MSTARGGLVMKIDSVKKLLLLAGVLLFGACTSSGIIPANMNLSLKAVEVTQAPEVSEGSQFSHKLKEEIRYEFSKAEQGSKRAKIILEIRELTYKDSYASAFKKGANMMASFGKLIDVVSGESIGEFPLRVTTASDGVDAENVVGRQHIHSELIQKTAWATLEKIYGKSRATKIGKQYASHKREPYFVQVVNPVRLSSLPVNITNGLPDTVIVEPQTAVAEGDDLPKVIEAPQIPVQ